MVINEIIHHSETSNKNEDNFEMDEENIKDMKGKRLEIYTYLVKHNPKAIGARQLQRFLEWSSVSLVDYHLRHLMEINLVEKTGDNKYRVKRIISHIISEPEKEKQNIQHTKSAIFPVYSAIILIASVVLMFGQLWSVFIIVLMVFLLSTIVKELLEYIQYIRQIQTISDT